MKAIGLTLTVLCVAGASLFATGIGFAQQGQELTASGPIACSGNQEIVINNRLIETSGNGVVVGGDCELVITGSRVVAGRVGIIVRDNGEVLLSDSFVQGAEGAIVVQDNGEMMYSGNTLQGGVRTFGNAGLIDQGGNKIAGAVTGTRSGIGIESEVVEAGGTNVRIRPGSVAVEQTGGSRVEVVEGAGVRVLSDDTQVVVEEK